MEKNADRSGRISTSELWAKLFRSSSLERYLAGSEGMKELPSLSEFICMPAEERKRRRP
jgi:hypothetical protein